MSEAVETQTIDPDVGHRGMDPLPPVPAPVRAPAGALREPVHAVPEILPQDGGGDCGCGCGGRKKAGDCGCKGVAAREFVYAVGTVQARFPSLSLEQEFRSAWGATHYSGPISQADIYRVLSQGQNLYIAREMCWVFQIEDVDVYLLSPRSYVELSDLILALAPSPTDVSLSLIVGPLGPTAPPDLCNGLELPIVTCNQVFYFTVREFIKSIIEHAERIGKTVTEEAAEQAFGILSQLLDNNGQTDEHRAINYMAFRTLDIYVKETEVEAKGFKLANVQAQPSRLSGTRRIVDVIFIYNNVTSNEVQQFFARVDVTGQFPFLVTGLQPYFDRP